MVFLNMLHKPIARLINNIFIHYLVLFIKILTCFSVGSFSRKIRKRSLKKIRNTTQFVLCSLFSVLCSLNLIYTIFLHQISMNIVYEYLYKYL